MALPDVAPLLNKEFVIQKLDFDRGIGAKDIEKRYIDKDQGLPWFAFINGDGKALVTSNLPNGNNLGHPFSPEEVAQFKVMLQKAKQHLTDAEIDKLIEILVAKNKADG